MKALPDIQGGNGRVEWFATSGFRHDADVISSPRSYAQRLIRYIRDDSTVRARVIDRFGPEHAPSREEIAAMRDQRMEHVTRQNAKHEVGEAEDYDRFDFVAWERAFVPQVMIAAERQSRISVEAEKRKERSRKMAALLESINTRVPEAKAIELRQGRPMGRPPGRVGPGDPEGLIKVVEHLTGMMPGSVVSRSRARPFIRARALATVLLKARGNSWPATGDLIGNRDHSSAINLGRVFFSRELRDPVVMEAWQRLAPCIVGAARTFEEFRLMVEARP
ncbi:hypothetical protein [Novosphingobium sp. KN65.2]|uniref:hypothetical protein n=1 Tax=Novosphingobium sp. KN65.2 TaxID=1478134 RepID=UPI0005E15496|nr:hypothetical protein [Novosphingobium sp. KN65.2]CDO35017.1 hypothetical protein SPHV1_2180029 [Novosphingobium sp. KN65.2]